MQMIKLKDGLYSKQFVNGVVMIEDRPFVVADATKMASFVRIKEGKAFLANSNGETVAELTEVKQ
jgi:hypothetical protein